MAKSTGNRGGSKGGNRGAGKSGNRGKGPGGWPSKTGNLSGGNRNNAPPKGKSK